MGGCGVGDKTKAYCVLGENLNLAFPDPESANGQPVFPSRELCVWLLVGDSRWSVSPNDQSLWDGYDSLEAMVHVPWR